MSDRLLTARDVAERLRCSRGYAYDVMRSMRHVGRSAATIAFYGTKLSHVARLMGPDTPLARVTAIAVDEYIAARKVEGAAAYTVSKELTALRMLLRHARRRGEFARDEAARSPTSAPSRKRGGWR